MIIIDNAFPKSVFARLQEASLGEFLPWQYNKTVYGDTNESDENFYVRGWTHLICHEGAPQSPLYALFEAGFLTALDNMGKELGQIERVRLNANTTADKNYTTDAHVDYSSEHMTALLYMNDCDGDTIIYNERFDPTADHSAFDYFQKLKDTFTVKERITPKANRLVIFDGLHYHCGSTPTNAGRRVVVNINFRYK